MSSASRLAIFFLALVSLAHLIRVLLRINVMIGGVNIPLWVSILAVVVTGGLAGLLWREQKRRNGSKRRGRREARSLHQRGAG